MSIHIMRMNTFLHKSNPMLELLYWPLRYHGNRLVRRQSNINPWWLTTEVTTRKHQGVFRPYVCVFDNIVQKTLQMQIEIYTYVYFSKTSYVYFGLAFTCHLLYIITMGTSLRSVIWFHSN